MFLLLTAIYTSHGGVQISIYTIMRSTHLLRSLLLPPLPPRSEWPTKFPPSAFRLIAPVIEGRPIRKGTQPRVQVADEELAEEFVESFGIEEGSTVIEGYAGGW